MVAPPPDFIDAHAEPVRIGVSACLLGAEVRFDAQHKRDSFLADELSRHVEWVSVCPEVEVGMGVPRESVRLVRGAQGQPLMLGNRSGADWTARMKALARARAKKLVAEDLSGYVLKANSPSCGMERVKLYESAAEGAPAERKGTGLFAAALMAALPSLPVEEEGRLHDPGLRENFIERVFAYHRLRGLWRTRWTLGSLVAFHTAHKMTLLAHSTDGYRALGRLVADGKKRSRAALRADYEAEFMAVLKKLATRGRHTHVLMHMMGHLRGGLDAAARQELLLLIEDYRQGLVPLIVPVTLLAHHVNRLNVAYLQGQVYLRPHPKELMLRNHV
jgi:uncharacterized protein YbgA (DUF1722 family)/uncharacterized protein YbbK (DUF523 family)